MLEHPEVPVVRHSVSGYGKWRREILVPVAAPAILHELSEHFDVVWVSAWAHTAHPALQAALDLPAQPWPWIGLQFNKLPAIRQFAAGRRWVWIDDSIDDLGLVSSQPDGILVRVDSHRGITDVDPQALSTQLLG